jgi:hypothetical protein
MWKVGDVMSVDLPGRDGGFGYGFNVTSERGNPVVLFAYETQAEAEAAANQVQAAVGRAVLVKALVKALP